MQVARLINLDLRNAPRAAFKVADGRVIHAAYVPVELTLAESATHFIRWTATVGFAPIPRGVFGFACGLEHFHVSIDALDGRFSLTPHVNIPATDRAFPDLSSP